jgi:hypothetical protein
VVAGRPVGWLVKVDPWLPAGRSAGWDDAQCLRSAGWPASWLRQCATWPAGCPDLTGTCIEALTGCPPAGIVRSFPDPVAPGPGRTAGDTWRASGWLCLLSSGLARKPKSEFECWSVFLSFRPHWAPKPSQTGPARQMVQNAPKINPGEQFECHFVPFSVPWCTEVYTWRTSGWL